MMPLNAVQSFLRNAIVELWRAERTCWDKVDSSGTLKLKKSQNAEGIYGGGNSFKNAEACYYKMTNISTVYKTQFLTLQHPDLLRRRIFALSGGRSFWRAVRKVLPSKVLQHRSALCLEHLPYSFDPTPGKGVRVMLFNNLWDGNPIWNIFCRCSWSWSMNNFWSLKKKIWMVLVMIRQILITIISINGGTSGRSVRSGKSSKNSVSMHKTVILSVCTQSVSVTSKIIIVLLCYLIRMSNENNYVSLTYK